MKKIVKRLVALSLAMVLSLGVLGAGNVAYAAEGDGNSIITELGLKTAEQLSQGRYEITVDVPGMDSDMYNEIIVMVDASDSQGKNFDSLVQTMKDIGAAVLNEKGTVRLTLMGFALSGKTVGSFTNMEDLEACVNSLTRDDLWYGRSATNCEAAFDHIQEYIEKSPNLHKAYVIYTSDGQTNHDETLFDWSKWMDRTEWFHGDYNTIQKIVQAGTGSQADMIVSGGQAPLAITVEHFPEESAAVMEARETGDIYTVVKAVNILYPAMNAVNEEGYPEVGVAWMDAIWHEAFAEAGLDIDNEKYSISDAEKALVDYFKRRVTGPAVDWMMNPFYLMIYWSKNSMPDGYYSGERAGAACTELASMDQVERIYMIGYPNANGATTWMNPESSSAHRVKGDNIEFTMSSGVNGAIEEISNIGTLLAATGFNDVSVTDPMSKWVILEPDTIRVYDGKNCIWDAKNGWLIEESLRPTAKDPIVLSKDPVTGHDVITWNIKDGALTTADDYSMKYIVTVNKEAEGFVSGEMYPANDPTYVNYYDEDGDPKREEIKVPKVTDKERVLNIEKQTVIKTENGNVTYPLEGIVFDVYYLCTVDEYTANLDRYETPSVALVAGQTPVVTLTTDVTGKAFHSLTANGDPDGIYLIIERDHPAVVEPLDPFLVAIPMTSEDGSEWIYTVNIVPKNTILPPPVVNKDVNAIGQDSDSVNVGDDIEWIIRVGVPADIAAAKEFVITDTLDYQLTYAGDNSLAAKIALVSDTTGESEKALVKGRDYILTSSKETLAANDEEVDKLTISLTAEGMAKIAGLVGEAAEDYEIRVSFDAVIDEDAQMGAEIPNQFALHYKNSVGFEYDVESDKPYVYTCGVNILKYDAKDSEKLLDGAVFKLARVATEEEIQSGVAVSLVVGKNQVKQVVYVEFYDNASLTGEKVNMATTVNGKALMYGLENGEYFLVETKAPAGYNLLSYPVAVTLNEQSHWTGDIEGTEIVETDNSVKVANSNTFKLPETGGIGTIIFTVSGGLMTLAGGTILALKKREEE